MAEYIEREALVAELSQGWVSTDDLYCIGLMTGIDRAIRTIFRQPAADVVERKRGRWVMKETMIRSPFAKNAYCSECLEETSAKYNFCPNCGADMRER